MKTKVLSFLFLGLLAACEPKPQPIPFGNAACDYCHMTVVDRQYAAQLVSSTGKVYHFDAVECMLHFEESHQDSRWALQSVCSFADPGNLYPAGESRYLVTEALPSPMGAYITPVHEEEAAEKLQDQHGGELYDLERLKADFHNKKWQP